MKIAFNALSSQVGGGITGFRNLLPKICEIDKKNDYIIFISSNQKEIREIIPLPFKVVTIDYIPKNPYFRVLWEQLILPFYLLFFRVDLIYSVGNITSLLAPCKIILLIQNSNPYSLVKINWTKQEILKMKFLKLLGRLSAKRANRIVFVSNNSKELISKQLNLAKEKCVTIYHGFDEHAEAVVTKEEFFPKYNYILSVAVVAPHKNIEALVNSFDILIRKYNYEGNLLIVGDLCYEAYVAEMSQLINELNLSQRIMLTGKIEHKKIKPYYTNADVFVLPSIEETFGIPVIEAMGYGVPVAVSDGALPQLKNYYIPFREICEDAAEYFNPFEPESIAESIHKIISDLKYKENLILKGLEQVKKFNSGMKAKSIVRLIEEFKK